MSIPYFDKGSANPKLPMNQKSKPQEPVAWRSRELPDGRWRVHDSDPTKNLKAYARGRYEVEPLFTATKKTSPRVLLKDGAAGQDRRGTPVVLDADGALGNG